jgi:hypothetical protein
VARSFGKLLVKSPWKKEWHSLVVPEGGSDPKNFLGGSAAKKWGRSRPFQSFFHGDFCWHCVSYLLRVEQKWLHLRVMKVERAKVWDVILTFFTRLP